MNYFEGITNEEFRQYYLKDLHCTYDLVYYVYPNEQVEDDMGVDHHIMKCQDLLRVYIAMCFKDNDHTLTREERDDLCFAKSLEICKLASEETEAYYKKAKAKLIQL